VWRERFVGVSQDRLRTNRPERYKGGTFPGTSEPLPLIKRPEQGPLDLNDRLASVNQLFGNRVSGTLCLTRFRSGHVRGRGVFSWIERRCPVCVDFLRPSGLSRSRTRTCLPTRNAHKSVNLECVIFLPF
jgi:hypothetical protein